MPTEDYSAADAIQITAASPTQLEHLVRTRVIVPAREASRRGVSRRYSQRNLLEIAIAADMLDAGITAFDISRSIDLIRDWKPQDGDEIALALLRSVADARGTDRAARLMPQLLPLDDVARVALKSGFSVFYAINVSWLAKQLRDTSGERLA